MGAKFMMSLINGNPRDTAIVSQMEEISYADLESRISSFQKGFEESDLFPGQKVALRLDTSPHYIITVMALLRFGAMVCPLSTRLTKEGVDEALKTLGAHAMFTAENTSTPIFLDRKFRKYTAAPDERCRGSVAIFTSGSTGTPKAAVLSQSNLIHSGHAANARLSFDQYGSWLMSLPIYHVGGLGIVVRAMLSGGSIILPNKNNLLEQELADRNPSHVSLVSTQLHRLLNETDAAHHLAKCRCVLMGGSAMRKGLIDQAIASGIKIHTSYGMTETAALVTCTADEFDPVELATSGTPLQEDSIRINFEGCIEVGGPARFQGYLVDGEIDEPFTDDGWFTTSDKGEFTEEGLLTITGRVDNMFISGGENIQPEMIEQALGQIDGVLRSVVVPVEDDEFGFRPAAFVEVVENDYDPDTIETQLRNMLPGLMVPAHMFPWPESEAEKDMKIDRAEWIDRAKKLVYPG
jgi:O-succinylbenzoic acid--CoA ligase